MNVGIGRTVSFLGIHESDFRYSKHDRAIYRGLHMYRPRGQGGEGGPCRQSRPSGTWEDRQECRLQKFTVHLQIYLLYVAGEGGGDAAQDKNMEGRSPTFIWAPVYSCTIWLRPRNSPPPHLGSYTRALLVSKQTTSLCNPLGSSFRPASQPHRKYLFPDTLAQENDLFLNKSLNPLYHRSTVRHSQRISQKFCSILNSCREG